MNLIQFSQLKTALKTKRAKALVLLLIGFLLAISAIFWASYEAIVEKEFGDSFWILATLELGLALFAIKVCSTLWCARATKTKRSFFKKEI